MSAFVNHIKVFIIYFSGGMLLLSGCKVGKTYTQPDLKLESEYRFHEDSLAQDSATLGMVSWKEFFQDTILLGLIQRGIDNNYDMRSALLNIQKADKVFRQSKLNFLPQVNADIADISYLFRSSDFRSGPLTKWYEEKGKDVPENMFLYQSDHMSGLHISWEMDVWGKIASRKEEALANYLSTYEARKTIQTGLVTNIARGYTNLMILDAQINVAKRNLALNDSTLHMIRLQFKAGEISALAIQQTESQRLIAASLIPELEQEIAIQENTLLMLTGEMPGSLNRLTDLDSLLSDSLPVNMGSPISLIRNRPDIREAELSLMAANAQANVRQALLYPSFTIGGSMGIHAMLAKNWFNVPGALFGALAGGITQPVFQGRRLRTDLEVARLERDQAEIDLQRTVLEAVNEVTNYLVIVDKQKEQLDFAEQRVKNAQLAVKNANLLFKSGYATYLEVITAQGNALNSDLNLVRMKQNQMEAIIDLYRALGGGWAE